MNDRLKKRRMPRWIIRNFWEMNTPGAKRIPTASAPFVIALALGLTLVSGCQDAQHRNASRGGMERAIAVVNNEPIPYDKFIADYELFLTKWDRFIGNNQRKKRELKEILLNQKIENLLLDQEARRKGVRVAEKELRNRTLAYLSPYIEEGKEEVQVLPEESMAKWTESFRQRLTHEKLVKQEVINKIRVTPSEMWAYYQKKGDTFNLPERVKVRHLAVGSKALYNRVMRLIERRQDFVELVRKYSITPDRQQDGDLGYVERGVLPSEFDEVIFKMQKVGSINTRRKQVQTQIGYHIFRLEGRQPAEKLTYRQAIPEIRRRLILAKQSGAYKKWLEGLREKATISIEHALLNAE